MALSSVGVFSACCAGRTFASVDGLGAGGVPLASAWAAGRLAPRAGTEGVLPHALRSSCLCSWQSFCLLCVCLLPQCRSSLFPAACSLPRRPPRGVCQGLARLGWSELCGHSAARSQPCSGGAGPPPHQCLQHCLLWLPSSGRRGGRKWLLIRVQPFSGLITQ